MLTSCTYFQTTVQNNALLRKKNSDDLSQQVYGAGLLTMHA